MAFAAVQHVLVDNYEGGSGMLAGSAVRIAVGTSPATVERANRANAATYGNQFVGVLADDTTNSGNTSAIIDGVTPGNYSFDSSDGLSVSTYFGPDFVNHPARRLDTFLDERLTTRTDWTTAAGTAKRGVAVYSGTGTRVLTDQFSAVDTTTSETNDVAAVPTFAVGTALTYGSSAGGTATNIGKFVEVDATTIADATLQYIVVARVVSYNSANGLLEIRLS